MHYEALQQQRGSNCKEPLGASGVQPYQAADSSLSKQLRWLNKVTYARHLYSVKHDSVQAAKLLWF